MRRVEQRGTGWPGGECVRATYAMLLDLPYEDVPRFDPEALRGRKQRLAERVWLASLGLDLIEVCAPPGRELADEELAEVPEVYHLISGRSVRGFGHRCLGYAGYVAADPHPSQAGLETIESVGLLVPLRNARFT